MFDLFMAPSSQELEPPSNPGRFRDLLRVLACRPLRAGRIAWWWPWVAFGGPMRRQYRPRPARGPRGRQMCLPCLQIP
ncbi:MAG: hypothetical protein CVU19_18090 [Betaproteobacteria bacterium HGW-Betaproteobacteria-13]|nr:MAG: hypothetical protein CVU19_18090 [Betaproteobacteria bacterium HGW-Betaproteobacteria-13]